jgi:hypothetical protein
VLCTLARLSGSCFRSIDTVGRLGRGIRRAAARRRPAMRRPGGRRLAQRLAETPVEHEGQRIVAA